MNKPLMIMAAAWLGMLILAGAHEAGAETPLVRDGQAAAILVIADEAAPIAAYAAEELAYHVEQASGVRLAIVHESAVPSAPAHRVYIGETEAAQRAGVEVDALPSEAFVLRTHGSSLLIAAKDGPGDPLSVGNTFSGTLWGVYEIIERDLGVRWLWPGELGQFIPESGTIFLPDYDVMAPPRFNMRNLRPQVGLRGAYPTEERLGFSPEARAKYRHDQSVFLRRHRMGRSTDSSYHGRKFGRGHAFGNWWEWFGETNPEFFHQSPDGTRGPTDPERLHDYTMCVSNPDFHRKIVELWQEERAKYPDQQVDIGIGENDTSAKCVCDICLDWDGPPPDFSRVPPGTERSYTPTQAGARYARFAKEVHRLASAIDPNVKVEYYAYLNYFWAPPEGFELHPNIHIGFVPWFRWAGWFPRTEQEHEWIKEQWLGWQRTGASVFYRPNWFLDGHCMPHVYMRQFADAFQFYAGNGMTGTDFDSLQGQWGAQGPNLYLLARLHVRPEAPVDSLLEEYYQAFGPAADLVEEYFTYWEDYSTANRERAAEAIRSRRGGSFRRYAMYGAVADELYPPEVFPPAYAILNRAQAAAERAPNPVYTERVAFLRTGLDHARAFISLAQVMNSPGSTAEERAAALTNFVAYRRGIEHIGASNMDRMAVIETDSWRHLDGFLGEWSQP